MDIKGGHILHTLHRHKVALLRPLDGSLLNSKKSIPENRSLGPGWPERTRGLTQLGKTKMEPSRAFARDKRQTTWLQYRVVSTHYRQNPPGAKASEPRR